MSDIKLGELITDVVERDAIHIAIVPVRATETLKPGQHIGLKPDSELFVGKSFKPHIGIVDPFLKKPVLKDEIFYLCLYQNTVTGMRHHWSHPSFSEKKEDVVKVQDSYIESLKLEFTKLADSIDMNYSKLYNALEEYDLYNDFTYNGSDDSYANLDGNRAWEIYQELSGRKVDKDKIGCIPFSCSC